MNAKTFASPSRYGANANFMIENFWSCSSFLFVMNCPVAKWGKVMNMRKERGKECVRDKMRFLLITSLNDKDEMRVLDQKKKKKKTMANEEDAKMYK